MGEGARVLVVEDDASLSEIVCTLLEGEGMACVPAFSGSEARMLLEREERFDLVICDLMLPGMPGEELVPLVRDALGSAPIIVTSARSGVTDRVTLLRTGADDYLVKPFDLEELLARVEVQLRRGGTSSAQAGLGSGEKDGTLVFGPWELDASRRTFLVGGSEVHLTRTEFDIAETLMRSPARVFTKCELYRRTCHDGACEPTLADERSVTTHVGNLRAKLRPSGTDSLIETVWGIGFKLRERP